MYDNGSAYGEDEGEKFIDSLWGADDAAQQDYVCMGQASSLNER